MHKSFEAFEKVRQRMISIVSEDFIQGSIKRETFKQYNRRYLYRYRGVVADLVNGNAYIHDETIKELLDEDKLPLEEVKKYNLELKRLLLGLIDSVHETDEQWFYKVIQVRRENFSQKSLSKIRDYEIKRMIKEDIFTGINQWNKLKKNLLESSILYIFISECKYLTLMYKNIKELSHLCDEIHVVVNDQADLFPPTKTAMMSPWISEWNSKNKVQIVLKSLEQEDIGFNLKNESILNEQDLILGYGEWCLGAFKGLNINSYVICESNEIISRGLTNALDKSELHCIYIPKHFDLIHTCTIVEKSVFNYRVYDWLSETYGDGVYNMSPKEILNEYPEFFLSHDLQHPLTFLSKADVFENEQDFMKYKVKTLIEDFDSSEPSIEIKDTVLYDSKDDPMKVTTALIKDINTHEFKIESFSESKDIRKHVKENSLTHGIVSNFLFFTTEKSIGTFNGIRHDREKEQFNEFGWHIDYMKQGNRRGAPLYNKAVFGQNLEGDLIFERLSMGGGFAEIDGKKITWSDAMVNSDDAYKVKVYSPLYDMTVTDAYFDYAKTVGENRVNLVVINGKLSALRKGDVILPNIGLVISLEVSYFTSLFPEVSFDETGYREVKDIPFKMDIDASKDYRWAFGGGMFLIYKGQAFDTEEKLKREFEREGWMSNLSKQTQDSETFRLDKHPRTAIGMTKKGEFFIIVCAGRSQYSVGADYLDLIKIAHSIYGDVAYLMNVDGGASSFLGTIKDSEVLVLSDITFTNDSCAGTLRPLNSILSIL
jgi:hypothetical protein